MKVLAIDNQLLVLLPLENKLHAMGYDVKTTSYGKVGKSLFKSFQPDLVIVDLNMQDVSGIDIIENIRATQKKHTTIMALSSDNNDKAISEAIELGVAEFVRKPLSFQEICIRVQGIIGQPEKQERVNNSPSMIKHAHRVGMVIPCHNNATRLRSSDFIQFVNDTTEYHLCFVNDGSTDNTLESLKELRKGRESHVSIYDSTKHGGKAEAIRLGMLQLYEETEVDYMGYLDCDLSISHQDFNSLVTTIENSDFKMVSGSRSKCIGVKFIQGSARKILGTTLSLVIRKIIAMNFKGALCGAKIFSKDVIPLLFGKKFITQWLFDLEILMRMRMHFGAKKAVALMYEKPLEQWGYAEKSSLSMKDSLQVVGQLAQIKKVYSKKYDSKKLARA